MKRKRVSRKVLLLRKEYKRLMENALYGATKEEWNKAVKELAYKRYGKKPTPEQWVEAAKDATTKCDVCQGSGRYYWGACINGQMTKSGPCFRCESKGFFTQDDHYRNRVYDSHRKVI